MLISQLINQLIILKTLNGDIEVIILDADTNWPLELITENIVLDKLDKTTIIYLSSDYDLVLGEE